MEPAEAKVRLTYKAIVKKVEEKFSTYWLSGSGADAKFHSYSLGWYILYEGSWEYIYTGLEKPPFDPGDAIKVTMEKLNGKSS